MAHLPAFFICIDENAAGIGGKMQVGRLRHPVSNYYSLFYLASYVVNGNITPVIKVACRERFIFTQKAEKNVFW
jgi:hypothetical protein